MKINSINIYSKNILNQPRVIRSNSLPFAGASQNQANKNGFLSNASKLKNSVADKFCKSLNSCAKDKIFQRYNSEFDEICAEHQTTRDNFDSLITKFDNSSLNKETELVLDEDKNLKHALIRNVEDDTKSLKLNFDKEKLSGATYIIDGKKIKMNIKSHDFTKSFLLPFDFDMNTSVLIGDMDHANLADGHILEHFESLNNVIYGKMPWRLSKAINEYEEKFDGKKIYVDHNIEPAVVRNCIEILQSVSLDEIPQSILLTNFLENRTSGIYCKTDEVVIRPSKNKKRLERSLFHEMQHRKDYLAGKHFGQKKAGGALMFNHWVLNDCDGQILEGKIEKSGNTIFFKDEELKKLIKNKVSNYATTDAAEFIAEVGSMMRNGTIGVSESIKTNNTLYSIKNNYKNLDLKDSTINEEEFKTLIKTYELLGGTPEFNNKIYCKDSVFLTQEDIFVYDK